MPEIVRLQIDPQTLFWLVAALVSLLALAWVLHGPIEPRRAVPWNGLATLAALLLLLAAHLVAPIALIGLTKAAGIAHGEELSLHQGRMLLGGTIVANATAILLCIAWLANMARARGDDFGFNTRKLGADIGWGASVFLLSAVPIFLLQAMLSEHIEGQHPIEALLRKHREVDLALLAVGAAVLAAPLAEEFFFRVVLQGWLEKWWSSRGQVAVVETQPPSEMVGGEELIAAAPMAPAAEPVCPVRTMWPPIIGSAAVFALAHLGHGPDPIPLFFLSLVLGYLYQRTHRIWPSLVVHVLLNSVSMTALLIDARR